jgi:hypothetical protein
MRIAIVRHADTGLYFAANMRYRRLVALITCCPVSLASTTTAVYDIHRWQADGRALSSPHRCSVSLEADGFSLAILPMFFSLHIVSIHKIDIR